jgi:aminoglycoside phosphotransferase (APT) family kinase protein
MTEIASHDPAEGPEGQGATLPAVGNTGSRMPGSDVALTTALARWLAVNRGLTAVEVGHVGRPAAGYSGETIFVDVTPASGGTQSVEHLVLRLVPPQTATFAEFDLVPQWQAQVAASHVGVPIPDPVLETDPAWLGSPFIVMPRVEGHIIGGVAFQDPWLSELSSADQGLLYERFLATVAAIHRADPNEAPAVVDRDNEAMLGHWEHYLSWSTDGHPVPTLVAAIEWCRRHLPRHESPAALLWGDVRFENMILGDDLSPRAVLDWDMTMVGAPEHDLAWFTSLDDTAHRLFGHRVEGFPDRDATAARFQELIGRPVGDLEWYETLAMVRSTAIMSRIGVLRQHAGKKPLLPINDNPILDLLRARLT